MKQLSLIISIIGIFLLLLIINYQQPEVSTINQLTTKKINDQVSIIGQITNTKVFQNQFTILNMQDSTGKINIICNCPKINQNTTLKITGRLIKYQNQLEIQADKIQLAK